jgi:hypothetical protein
MLRHQKNEEKNSIRNGRDLCREIRYGMQEYKREREREIGQKK